MPTVSQVLAADRAELAALYARIVGYDPFADEPSLTDDDVASMLLEFMVYAA